MDVITGGQSTTIFYEYYAFFAMVTTTQLGDPSASLLSTSEKAVFCNSRCARANRRNSGLEMENCIL